MTTLELLNQYGLGITILVVGGIALWKKDQKNDENKNLQFEKVILERDKAYDAQFKTLQHQLEKCELKHEQSLQENSQIRDRLNESEKKTAKLEGHLEVLEKLKMTGIAALVSRIEREKEETG